MQFSYFANLSSITIIEWPHPKCQSIASGYDNIRLPQIVELAGASGRRAKTRAAAKPLQQVLQLFP